jgi:hypothetical protein
MAQLKNAAAYMTLSGALDELARRGFTARFQVFDGGLRAAGGGETMRPRDLVIREYYRFEGISDPDDMAILYAIESTSGVRGTLADAFGVYSDPATSEVMQDVPIRANGSGP